MDSTLRNILIARLEKSDLDTDARRAVRAETDVEVGRVAEEVTATGEVYLRSVTVEGFRGIGPAATLGLAARPGLTVVVGRNGSGKSSFAEGLELLLTGRTKRWESKTKGWTSAWQCLHHDRPTRLRAELVVAGQQQPVTLDQTWARRALYTDTAGRAAVAASLATHGWDRALGNFRPFLAYAELASMFDKLTSLYEALSPILGLGNVDAVLERLSARRLELDGHIKELKAKTEQLRESLVTDDPRQAKLAELLSRRSPDVAAVQAHVSANPPGTSAPDPGSAALRRLATLDVPEDEAIRRTRSALDDAAGTLHAVAATDASRALAIADLLTGALALRDPARLADDCPVCRSTGVLDAAWAAEAHAEAQRLRTQASELGVAQRAHAAAASDWRTVTDRLSSVVGEAVGAELDLDESIALASRARKTVSDARARLERQDAVWRGHIEATTAWLSGARQVESEAHDRTTLRAAEKWLKEEADALRNERFAPIADQAIANWELLKHESNIELRDITLRTVGRRREASFDVRADGEEANALGVMSQGELLALSVSVFLPRAGLDESPFRFAVIDDPVQSMDPAKVDGLARVLGSAATTRQLVVFTHDDRLPEAIRRLKLEATVLQVHRRSRSQVSVQESLTPMRRHLDEAKVMARSKSITEDVRRRVVPSLCREAVEAACAEIVRSKAIARGQSAASADEQLRATRTLRSLLALALLDDAGEHMALNQELRRLGPDAPALVVALNAGAHGDYGGSAVTMHARTHDLVVGLMQST
jgi:energy-coupling factor transporter ATP-binding protein EcfA2